MAEASNTTVTLQVHRFTPRPERAERARGGSPFAKKGSPFGGGSDSAARRRPRGKQWVQEYTIPARPSDTVLDCLLTIKRTVDPTLAFRYSCGHGMCGSDAVAINGTPTLLCTATIRDWAKQPGAMPEVDDERFRHTGTEAEESDDSAENVANAAAAQNSAANGSLGVIELASLPGFPPQRDLIADIDPMLNQIRKLTPYLQADGVLATTAEGKVDVFEYLQNPEQLAKYELLSNCIACGVCEGACPVYAGGDAFIGPACPICGYSMRELEPRLFSFNNPAGACPTCDGLGVQQYFDPDRVIQNPELSLAGGAIRGWDRRNFYYFQMLKSLADHYKFDVEAPWGSLSANVHKVVLYGSGKENIEFKYMNDRGDTSIRRHPFEGVLHNMERRYKETESSAVREELAKFISNRPCASSSGSAAPAASNPVSYCPLGPIARIAIGKLLTKVCIHSEKCRLPAYTRHRAPRLVYRVITYVHPASTAHPPPGTTYLEVNKKKSVR